MSLTIHGQLINSKPLPDIAKEMLLANFSNFSEKFVKHVAGNEPLIDKIYNLWIDQTNLFPTESNDSELMNLRRPLWFNKAVTLYGIGRTIGLPCFSRKKEINETYDTLDLFLKITIVEKYIKKGYNPEEIVRDLFYTLKQNVSLVPPRLNYYMFEKLQKLQGF